MSRPAALVVLLSLGVLMTLGRVYTYHEPLECDITTWAVIAHEMLLGRVLYSDLWAHQPPMIYLVFAAAEQLIGYGPGAVFGVNMFFAWVTLIGVYVAVAGTTRRNRAALWAAAAWTVLSLNLQLQANQPNAEVVINGCLIWVLAIFLRSANTKMSWTSAIVAGVLTAVATLTKQIAVLPVALIMIVYVLHTDDMRERISRLIRMVGITMIVMIAWAFTGGYFASTGRWQDFYDGVFTYNRSYAGDPMVTLIDSFQPYVVAYVIAAMLPAVIALVARGVSSRPFPVTRYLFMIAFALGTWIAVAMPGRWYPHYFQLFLPVIAVSVGYAHDLLQQLPIERRRWLTDVAIAVLFLPLVVHQALSYRLTPEQWSHEKYGRMYVEAYHQGLALDKLLLPGETFWHFGTDTGLYFYSRRSPITGVIFYDPLIGGPLKDPLTQHTLNELNAKPPDLIVIPVHLALAIQNNPVHREHPLIAWMIHNYRSMYDDRTQPYYVLLARPGSTIEARLRVQRGLNP